MTKTILIIGSGGREHALAWKIKQSPQVEKVFIAPGNAGTTQIGENVDIKVTDVLALADFAKRNKIDFTVVGSDDALAAGVVDEFQKQGLKIWGPTKAAAQIEWSKAFSKQLMTENNIPTAGFKNFTDYDQALSYVEDHFRVSSNNPIVIKASGLALGKGVAICKTLEEAKKFLADIMVGKIFGDSGSQVVIEEFLTGREFSIHAFSDGKNFKIFPLSQDHKTIYDGDNGPNTGGMGTIAPLPWTTEAIMDDAALEIVSPALKGLKKQGAPFVGVLYPGAIMTKDGVKVIEFNSRFGDPETQSYMRLLKTDLLEVLEACENGTLDKIDVDWENKYACCIILASGGYPGSYQKGFPISGIEDAEKLEDIIVFHAGTTVKENQPTTNGLPAKSLATAGGRVLGVTAIADDLQSALNKAYAAVKLINFPGMQYRTDIGKKSL